MIFEKKGYSHPIFLVPIYWGKLIHFINISANYVFTLY
jgi:hypothetical protein